MDNRVEVLTFMQLKKIILELDKKEEVTDDTKVFIDTGWDSVQEVEPKAIQLEDVVEFKVADELTKENYVGYKLRKKAEKADSSEKAVIIRNLY